MEEKMTFEQALNRLEEIVEKLQNGEFELEKAYSLFEEGIKLTQECEKKLTAIEQKMTKIFENGQSKDFEVQESES